VCTGSGGRCAYIDAKRYFRARATWQSRGLASFDLLLSARFGYNRDSPRFCLVLPVRVGRTWWRAGHKV